MLNAFIGLQSQKVRDAGILILNINSTKRLIAEDGLTLFMKDGLSSRIIYKNISGERNFLHWCVLRCQHNIVYSIILCTEGRREILNLILASREGFIQQNIALYLLLLSILCNACNTFTDGMISYWYHSLDSLTCGLHLLHWIIFNCNKFNTGCNKFKSSTNWSTIFG